MNFDNLIDLHGSSITLRTVTLSEIEAVYGTQSESYADSTVKAIMGIATEDNRLVRQGIIKAGDFIAYLKSGQAIKEGDMIVLASIDYEVIKYEKMYYQGNVAYIMATLKKKL